jgi:acyl dehydratase
MPSLPWLYARALRQAVRSSGLTRRRPREPDAGWSSEAVAVTDVRLGEDRLAAYRRVCGFSAGGTVPATYPQLLAFPLQLLVLTGPGFPFPAMGAVHVANTLEQHEPVSPATSLDLAVHATDLRPHRRGRQVSVVTEARVGRRTVWRAESVYLRVERSDSARDRDRTADLPTTTEAGRRGLAVQWELAADLGRRYAAVSGDRNPIHLYDLTARPFGFRRHMAHGMWTLARCLAQLEPELPPGIRCDVSFKRPVPLPGRVAFTASPEDGGWCFAVGSPTAPELHLSGRLVPR